MRSSNYEKIFISAIERMLADQPFRVPLGTRITQLSVIDETGFSRTVVSTIRRSYPEIVELILKAQKEQLKTQNAYTLKALGVYFEALERLKAGNPVRVKKGSKINILNVTLEAGRSVGSIRPSRENNAAIIHAIQQASKGLDNCSSNKNETRLLDALERIKNGTTHVVSTQSKPTQNTVAMEAGLCIRYISANKEELGGVISKIREAKQSYQTAM